MSIEDEKMNVKGNVPRKTLSISVVIPSHRPKVLTLKSVENIKPYIKEVIVEREGTTGQAMNMGAQKSKGDVLLFLDDDVKFTKSFFLEALHKLESNPKSLVGLRTSDGMSCMFMLIRRRDFFDVGGIHLNSYYLDTEFGFRAEKHGIKRVFYPVSSVEHLSPTPSGFYSKRQRLLMFNSCCVYLHYRDKYTENEGKFHHIKPWNFLFRVNLKETKKSIYTFAILFSGLVYYGLIERAWRNAKHLKNFLLYKIKTCINYAIHGLSLHLFFVDYLRLRKTRKLLSNLEYEPPVSTAMENVEGDIFVDIGENIGYYSILLSGNFKKIYAFEPFPDTYRKLRWHINKFNVANVIPVMKAVSDHNGEETLGLFDYYIPKFDPDTHIQLGVVRQNSKSPRLKVETVTLASFFPNTSIELVKVGVEGDEWKVLGGSVPVMKNIKRWVIELHDIKRRKEMETFLTSQGYSIEWLDNNHIYAERKKLAETIQGLFLPLKELKITEKKSLGS